MKLFAALLLATWAALGQEPSAIQTEPGTPVIQEKDLWEKSGLLHPFHRMPRFVVHDQAAVWSSPAHTAKQDIKWWAIFGGATAALIASDRWTVDQLPNSKTQVSISNWSSRVGSAYTLIPLSAGFYFIGSAHSDERLRETGLIAFETLIDANIVSEALKLATGRPRPLEGNGHGRFETSTNRWNASFPSGHAINSWALASVVAHEYPKPIVKILAYGLASTVVISRVGARRHFPGDVVAGAGIGWFMGDYLYGKRHNRALDRHRGKVGAVLDHVRLGVTLD